CEIVSAQHARLFVDASPTSTTIGALVSAAVATSTPIQPTISLPPAMPIVILGTDALLAAAPATPVQLAHACLRGGYTNVIPASWGDELIASAVIRALPEFAGGPAI